MSIARLGEIIEVRSVQQIIEMVRWHAILYECSRDLVRAEKSDFGLKHKRSQVWGTWGHKSLLRRRQLIALEQLLLTLQDPT
jgi:hypothetical protein